MKRVFPGLVARGRSMRESFCLSLRLKLAILITGGDDVKSLVVEEGGEFYYIDYYGNVRKGESFFKIDKKKFEENIKYDGAC